MLTNNNILLDLKKELTMKNGAIQTAHHKGVFPLFGSCAIRFRSVVGCISVGAMGLVLVGLVGGCQGKQTRDGEDTQYYTDQSSAVFAPETRPSAPPPESADDLPAWETDGRVVSPAGGGVKAAGTSGGWSIVVMRVDQGGMARAGEMLKRIQDDAGLKEAYIDQRNTGIVIAYGSYIGRDDPRAQKDLTRIRQTEMMGVKLFEGAIIAPPTSADLRGSNPAWDLRTVKQRYGKRAVYTLQIGVYGRSDYQTPTPEELALFRKAAEQAVRDLRAKGETAFYYHSPARSMVTVGVFGERDFDSTTMPPSQSPALAAARQRFPNNLLNGAGINETLRMESGKVKRLQSSQLVAIPDQ